jgi:Icc-related predicted phosphoesterase
MSICRVFFVTDVHGSDLCFRKFLSAAKSAKKADVLIIGGDITAKWLVPVVALPGGRARATFRGEQYRFETEQEVQRFERELADIGGYTARCEPDFATAVESDVELAERMLKTARIERLQRWMELADARLTNCGTRIFVNPGNDDPFYVDDVIKASRCVTMPEGQVIDIGGGATMISTGFVNKTPWDCPRDVDDAEVGQRMEAMMRQVANPNACVFNCHAPPYGTALDLATRLNEELRPSMSMGADELHVGSRAVREAIERYVPCVSLHGHVHEQHAYVRVGETVCFNPGTEYDSGLLRGVYLELEGGRLGRYGLTRETGTA